MVTKIEKINLQEKQTIGARGMELHDFLMLERQDIAKIVEQSNKPKCVTMMLDGTRRLLKLDAEHHSDNWLYYQPHIRKLVYKSAETADMLFDLGVNYVIGPLASFGNLQRTGFLPTGLDHLLSPIFDDYPQNIIRKWNLNISFYGDIDYAISLEGGGVVNHYKQKFDEINAQNPNAKHFVLLGLGFSTERDTKQIADLAIDFFNEYKKKPTHEELAKMYFGLDVPPVDIFIRSNEVRASGGLSPLLLAHDTQFYFPVSPGLISFSEDLIRRILYDYLFNRTLPSGYHLHQEITADEADAISTFYYKEKDEVLGLGNKIGDIWLANLRSNKELSNGG